MPYSQNFQKSASQSSYTAGSPVTSQYRGTQSQFQPAGAVQSFYGQNQQNFGAQGAGQYQFQPSPQSFHTANYRGNQPGHDQRLRGDANNPNVSAFSQQAALGISPQGVSQTYRQGISQSFTQNQGFSQYQSQPSPQSYHTANYRGNQPGQDQNLRSNVSAPNVSAFGQQGAFAPQSGFSQSFGQGISQQSGLNQGLSQYQSQQSPQSFHTANYRGNQQNQ